MTVQIHIGTPQTWAYINGQLDMPHWKRVRIHITENDHTLCGLLVGSWWETDITERDVDDIPWLCSNCYRGFKKKERVDAERIGDA